MQTDGRERFGVVLEADGLQGRRSGVGRVTVELAQAVRGVPAVAELGLLVGGAVALAETLQDAPHRAAWQAAVAPMRALAGRCPSVVAWHAARLRQRLEDAAQAMARRIDGAIVYHAPNLIARPFAGPTVVTVHDLSWRVCPDWHPAARVRWIEQRLPATLRQADRFVCVSAHTARCVEAELGVARGRIDVVAPGVSPLFRPMRATEAAPVLARYGLHDRRYVLAVSTLEPRKNLDRLLAAHGKLPMALRYRVPLVVAGGRGWGAALEDRHAMRARRDGGLRLLGHVPDTDLVALYGRAGVVAYPSLHEGFGLPVLEAMACGAPVVTSDSTALPETAGGAAVLVDPLDVDAIAGALRCVLEDDDVAGGLGARGAARAAGFTWDRTAKGMVKSWRAAL